MDVVIRTARLDDAEPVAALCGELGYPTTTNDTASRLAMLLARPDHRLLVAERAGDVVGWIHLYHALVLEAEPWVEVGGLVVAERARGRGVGRALLAAGERWASDQGYGVVRLRSNVIRTRAHEFYRQCGYETIKTQVNFRKTIAGRQG